jgi:tRNA threonylcarbamoyl adenosine modification protein YeaZ
MKILALEFSTLRRSVALLEDGRVLKEDTEEARRGGSPFPLIARVLEDNFPDALAIGLGPGSYTGIRSALAIAQGWNLAHGTLASGISSAEAIAFNAWRAGERGAVEVVIGAQRTEVYSACYEVSQSGHILTHELQILPRPRRLGKLIGPEATRWDSSGKNEFPTGAAIGLLAANASVGPPEILEPIYLREVSFVKAPPARHT